MFELTTYVRSKDEIKTALKAGANHLILEHPKYSLRSFINYQVKDSYIKEYAQYARKMRNNITLSFNLDILPTDGRLSEIRRVVGILKDAHINLIRIQDLGLRQLIKDVYPEAKLQLVSDTLNMNVAAVRFLTSIFERQTLSNLLTKKEIKEIIEGCQTEYEILVQGPILIHSSRRKYLRSYSAQELNKKKCLDKAWVLIDEDHPRKKLGIYENEHGSFIFAHYHQSLWKYYRFLQELGIRSFLIDARGCTMTYLSNALKAYKENNQKFIALIKKESSKPHQLGIFSLKKTDTLIKKINKTN
jgi:putative protease